MSSEVIAEVARLFRDAQRLLFVTGAGISADSGLPTYRGVGGLYRDVDTEDGMPIEEVLSGPMFAADPATTWKYIRQIEEACRGAEPNAAHRRIAELGGEREVWVLTQNVDGLHRDAGTENLIEIHGNVHDLRCTACGYTDRVADFAELAPLPRCPDCAAVVRPRVVLFGETLPADAILTLDRELGRGFDVVVSIGTSSLFPYIVEPVVMARARGRPAVEINPDETEISTLVTHHLALRAAAAMEAIAARMAGRD